jgi:hypothetical protein
VLLIRFSEVLFLFRILNRFICIYVSVLLIRFSEVVIILFSILIGLNCIYVSTPVGLIYCPNCFVLNLQEMCVCECN